MFQQQIVRRKRQRGSAVSLVCSKIWTLSALLSFLLHILATTHAFSLNSQFGEGLRPTLDCRSNIPMALFLAKRKKTKPSMAERLKRRQGKSRGMNRTNPFANLPPSNIDFTATMEKDDKSSKDPIEVASPAAAAEKAKELLKAQRDSVNMLTLVKERIQQTLSDDSAVADSLKSQGYAIVDNFLGDEAVLAEMEREGIQMLQNGNMQVDTATLGMGEYIIALQGGDQQYSLCPRKVELVVSVTKNVPEAFDSMGLDASACIATLRTFDRNSLKASLALLTGKNDDTELNIPENSSPLRPIVVDAEDQRKLSAYYYVVSSDWNESCGGGLMFQSGDAHAKRDRLVLLYSDSTSCRSIPWKGSDSSSALTVGNCIELHLVQKR
ncbi:hypothetical protein IV203_028663 [Nitzschia inconspicua]|uniref:Uncharacterized protein n=1 Tax=Nitzschia inconspicua TaxID=303405 RepID=A0A9K3LPB1_9STRA|nr:hypothetical protein IV203_028663 [Nitzschia inconspicua]